MKNHLNIAFNFNDKKIVEIVIKIKFTFTFDFKFTLFFSNC